jgi:hypothetical protein
MDIIRQFISLLGSIIHNFPMPFRALVDILILGLIIKIIGTKLIPWVIKGILYVIYQITGWIVSLLLFPEYIVTSNHRKNKYEVYGVYFHTGYVLQNIVDSINKIYRTLVEGLKTVKYKSKFNKISNIVILLFISYFTIVWLSYPKIENTNAKKFAAKSIAVWYSCEHKLINGVWIKPDDMVKQVEIDTAKPIPNPIPLSKPAQNIEQSK